MKNLVNKIVTWFKNLVTSVRRSVVSQFYKIRAKTTKNVFQKVEYRARSVFVKHFG